MQIQGTDLQFVKDPLTYASGLELVNGSTRQTYNESENEYETDRSQWALILIPWVSCSDLANGVEYGKLNLLSVAYQIGTYANGTWKYTDVNTTDADCHVFDGTNKDDDYPVVPKWALIFKRNIAPKSQCSIKVFANVTDPNTGEQRQFVEEIALETGSTRTDTFALRSQIGCVPSLTLDPLRVSKVEGKRTISLACQLQRNNADVEDADAVYFWCEKTASGWERLTPNNQLYVVTEFDANGNLPKEIVIDIDCFNSVSLRCEAAYFNHTKEARPTAADHKQVREACYFTRRSELDPRTEGRVDTLRGIKIDTIDVVERKVILTDSQGDIDDALAEEFYVCTWNRRLPNNAVKVGVASGFTAQNTASGYDMTKTQNSQLIPQVEPRKAYGIAVGSNGKMFVGSDGRVFTIRT